MLRASVQAVNQKMHRYGGKDQTNIGIFEAENWKDIYAENNGVGQVASSGRPSEGSRRKSDSGRVKFEVDEDEVDDGASDRVRSSGAVVRSRV